MIRRTSVVAAAVASAIWGVAALAQSTATAPPTSTSEDMQEQSAPTQETTPSETGSTTASGAATGAPEEGTLGTGLGTVDQTKVEKFADAYVQVQTIQQKANAELQTATDPAQADQVKTSAQSEMIAAVERTGLQIEEFNQIVASMAADTELRSRVSAEVQKRVGAGGPAGAGGGETGT